MGLYIKANCDTWLKKTWNKQADELTKDNKLPIEKGKNYLIKYCNPEIKNKHQMVDIEFDAGRWWLYMDHWDGLLPEEGYELKKKFESCELVSYPDPGTGGDPWTIGWGNTFYEDGRKVKRGDKITQERADQLSLYTCQNVFLKKLSESIPGWDKMNDKMRGALLSFAYNVGAGFYGSNGYKSITDVLKTKQYDRLDEVLMLYVNPGTRVEQGLRRRRKAEIDLFVSGWNEIKEREKKSVVEREFKGKILDVPYLSQRDNKYRPHQTCNITSVAMVLKYLGADIDNDPRIQDEDELYLKMIKQYGQDSIYYHGKLKELIESYGFKDNFITDGTSVQVIENIDKGFPVILSGKFTGSGHIVVIRGYDQNYFYVNDPYGYYDDNRHKYVSENGENVKYSYAMIRRLSYANTAGWIHLISK
jgi:lysozyme